MNELLALLISVLVVAPILLAVSAYAVATLLFVGVTKIEQWTKSANKKDVSK